MRSPSAASMIWGGVLLALAACAAPPLDDTGASTRSGVTEAAFNRNDLLEDTALLDPNAFDEADVQKLFEKTPWNTRSVLASYEDGGKRASKILVDAARAHGINPLALVVRLQMEQSLVYKTTAPDATLQVAFGCGCPHSPVCSDAYMGFANQAECAAGTLRRSMDAASTSTGTASGWKIGVGKTTEDDLVVTPKNAATTALYTYTPWVGEAGGGKAGVGGASLHKQVWDRFADNLQYKPHSLSAAPVDNADDDAGVDAGSPPSNDDPGSEGDDTPTDPTPTPEATDGGGGDGGTAAPTKPGTDDSKILEPNTTPPPAATIPPPRSKSTPTHAGDETTPSTDGDDATKSAAAGGCSTAPGRASEANDSYAFVAAALAASLVLARRRR